MRHLFARLLFSVITVSLSACGQAPAAPTPTSSDITFRLSGTAYEFVRAFVYNQKAVVTGLLCEAQKNTVDALLENSPALPAEAAVNLQMLGYSAQTTADTGTVRFTGKLQVTRGGQTEELEIESLLGPLTFTLAADGAWKLCPANP